MREIRIGLAVLAIGLGGCSTATGPYHAPPKWAMADPKPAPDPIDDRFDDDAAVRVDDAWKTRVIRTLQRHIRTTGVSNDGPQ